MLQFNSSYVVSVICELEPLSLQSSKQEAATLTRQLKKEKKKQNIKNTLWTQGLYTIYCTFKTEVFWCKGTQTSRESKMF